MCHSADCILRNYVNVSESLSRLTHLLSDRSLNKVNDTVQISTPESELICTVIKQGHIHTLQARPYQCSLLAFQIWIPSKLQYQTLNSGPTSVYRIVDSCMGVQSNEHQNQSTSTPTPLSANVGSNHRKGHWTVIPTNSKIGAHIGGHIMWSCPVENKSRYNMCWKGLYVLSTA